GSGDGGTRSATGKGNRDGDEGNAGASEEVAGAAGGFAGLPGGAGGLRRESTADSLQLTASEKRKTYAEVTEDTEFAEKRNPRPRHRLRAWGNLRIGEGLWLSCVGPEVKRNPRPRHPPTAGLGHPAVKLDGDLGLLHNEGNSKGKRAPRINL